jgi:hypothetical protein
VVLAAHDSYVLDCSRYLVVLLSKVVKGSISIGAEVEFCHDGLDGHIFGVEVHEQVCDGVGSFFSEPVLGGDKLEALLHELACCEMLILLHFLAVTGPCIFFVPNVILQGFHTLDLVLKLEIEARLAIIMAKRLSTLLHNDIQAVIIAVKLDTDHFLSIPRRFTLLYKSFQLSRISIEFSSLRRDCKSLSIQIHLS